MGPDIFIVGFATLFVVAVIILVYREWRRGARLGDPGFDDDVTWVHHDDHRSYHDGGGDSGGGDGGGD